MTTYFADLNPRYPATREKRWGVFLRRDESAVPTLTHLRFTTRRAAERAAARLTKQEANPTITKDDDARSEARWQARMSGDLEA